MANVSPRMSRFESNRPKAPAKHKTDCTLHMSRGAIGAPCERAGLPEQAIKYIAGGHAAQSTLRQRNTAEPAPAHARASAVEPNERVKRPRRDGALVTHNDAAANVDAHVAIDQARYAGAAMR